MTPQHSITEHERIIEVSVKLPGVASKQVDTLLGPYYIKVSGGGYLLAIDLFGAIDDEESRAYTSHASVLLKLVKAEPSGMWHRLHADDAKARRKARREYSVDVAVQRQQQRENKMKEAQQRLRNDALNAQMRVETERQHAIARNEADALDSMVQSIEELRHQTGTSDASLPEKEADTESVQPQQHESTAKAADAGNGIESGSDSDDDDDTASEMDANIRQPSASITSTLPGKEARGTVSYKHAVPDNFSQKHVLQELAIEPDRPTGCETGGSSNNDRASYATTADEKETQKQQTPNAESEDQKPVQPYERWDLEPREFSVNADAPPPRPGANVKVDFTQLEQNLMPARGSREKEIKEHKRKAERDKQGPDDSETDSRIEADNDRDIAEVEPVFLKDKGDSFMQRGDLRAAIEAYNDAEKRERAAPRPDGTLNRILANRSAVNLQSGDLHRAVEDCCRAISLIDQEIQEDEGETLPALQARKYKLLMRRADAKCQLNQLDEAVDDYELASKLGDKHGAQIAQQNLSEVEACRWPLDADGLKGRGNERLRAGDTAGALDAYSKALRLAEIPFTTKYACLSNTALCHIRNGDHGHAIDSCNRCFR